MFVNIGIFMVQQNTANLQDFKQESEPMPSIYIRPFLSPPGLQDELHSYAVSRVCAPNRQNSL